MPIVIEKNSDGERSYDLASRLLKDRIVLIDGGVDENLAHVVSAQLLWLESQSSDDITLYINSPGGDCYAGLKIRDTMEMIRCDVRVICSGMAASMGAYLLSCGTVGKRLVTKRATIMAHQVSSGTSGVITDQRIRLRQSETLNTLLCTEIAKNVGVSYEQFLKDCDRDNWMSAEEARDYGTLGFVDGIILGKDKKTSELLVEKRDGSIERI